MLEADWKEAGVLILWVYGEKSEMVGRQVIGPRVGVVFLGGDWGTEPIILLCGVVEAGVVGMNVGV